MFKFVSILLLTIISFDALAHRDDSLSVSLGFAKTNEERVGILIELGESNITVNAKKSLDYLLKAKEQIDNIRNDSLEVELYRWLGSAYHRNAKYISSRENYIKAIELSKEYGFDEKQALINAQIAYLLTETKNYQDAETYYREAERLYSSLPDSLNKIVYYTNYARYLEENGNVDSSILIRKKAVEESFPNDPAIAVVNLVNIAGEFGKMSKFDSSRYYYKYAQSIADTIDNPKSQAMVYINYGITEGMQGNYATSIEIIRKSIDYFSKTEPEGLLAAYHGLLQNFKYLNKKDSIIKYLELFHGLKDSLSQASSMAKIAELESSKETEIKDLELQEFQKKAKMQKKLNYSFIAFFIILFITILVLINFYRKQLKLNSKLKTLNIELDEKNRLLTDSKQELEKLNNTKDKFFSVIAHDLRNPVNSIKNGLEFIYKEKDSLSDDEFEELLDELNGMSLNLVDLLENLLSWSRSQRGLIKVFKEEFDVSELLIMNQKLFKPIAQAKDITIYCENSSLNIISDKNILNMILRNTINNAIKFTNNGGSITLNSEIINEKLVVEVKDTGTGIPPEKLEGIFSVEKSKSSIGTAGEKGTGLGLILCKEFADKLSAKIEFESEVDEGSTFRLILPDAKRN